MKSFYTRVKTDNRDRHRATGAAPIRWGAVAVALGLCVVQVLITIYANHRQDVRFTATQIPVLAVVFLAVLVMAVNPVLRKLHPGLALRRAELLTVFAAMFVTGGISVYGFVDQIIPIITTPFNPKWNTSQRGWDRDVIPYLDKRLFLADPDAVLQFREGLNPGQSLVHDVPWRLWAQPLFHWLQFTFLVYALFYFLSRVLYPQWADREKLIFPLTKIPEALTPPDDAARETPRILHSGLFWSGFAVSFGILLWNGAVREGWIHGIGQVPLAMNMSVLDGTFLKSIRFTFTFNVFFTALGIGFLLPPAITFSVWFYFLVHCAMIYLACSFGFGVNELDFPRNMRSVSNFITAQGGGAMMVFGAVCLLKALWGYRDTDSAGAAEATDRTPIWGLAGSILLLIGWMCIHFTHAGLFRRVFWAAAFTLVILLMTVCLMRLVAESGLFGYQAHTGPFHFARMFHVQGRIGAGVLGPLLTFYTVFFYDVKTFLAPALLNAERIREDAHALVHRFRLTILLAMGVSVVTAVIFSICLAYRVGAQQMQPWFYTYMTPMLMDTVRDMSEGKGLWSPANLIFALSGGIWTGISMFIRQYFFWFPHPIGYLLFANPLTRYYWSSFFLAWVIKRFVLKYGGRHSFDRIKPFFIGLILGELAAVAFWVCVVWAFHLQNVGIDIDRHAPSRGTGG